MKPLTPTQHVMVVVIALAVGIAGGWWARSATADEHRATPRVVEGWAYVGAAGGIGCCGEDAEHPGGDAYDVTGAAWRDARLGGDGSWHNGDVRPECLPVAETARVRLGYVDVAPTEHASGGQLVKWVECL